VRSQHGAEDLARKRGGGGPGGRHLRHVAGQTRTVEDVDRLGASMLFQRSGCSERCCGLVSHLQTSKECQSASSCSRAGQIRAQFGTFQYGCLDAHCCVVVVYSCDRPVTPSGKRLSTCEKGTRGSERRGGALSTARPLSQAMLIGRNRTGWDVQNDSTGSAVGQPVRLLGKN